MSLTSFFSDIANAIREKDGSTANIAASTFPERIRAILTGVDTGDATAADGDILSGKTAYVNGAKVTGTIASQTAQTITPGTADKTIASGKYLAGTQTIKGDANLKAENIRSGVSIFGVSGEFAAGINLYEVEFSNQCEDAAVTVSFMNSIGDFESVSISSGNSRTLFVGGLVLITSKSLVNSFFDGENSSHSILCNVLDYANDGKFYCAGTANAYYIGCPGTWLIDDDI